jgi:hypothetical protein
MRKHLFLYMLIIVLAGCKKYEEAPLVESPAYIRVFNDLATTVDVLHNGQSAPFFTFVMDPHMDKDGLVDTGAVVGDYLGTRQLFSLSYPINEANSSIGQGTGTFLYPINYEYPGNAHVLTAPAINGFDLSAWAQVPSGKHRVMFINRPQSNVPFKNLSAIIRKNILLDTIVNFDKGEVYTLEVVSRDLDRGIFGLYMRREAFIHQSFEENKIYTGFVNLSGVTPVTLKYKFFDGFSDRVGLYYTYNIYDDINSAPATGGGTFYHPLPGYNKTYYTTLNTRMDTVVPYLPLPLLPVNYFFRQDSLRTYADSRDVAYLYGTNYGSLPFVRFDMIDPDNVGPALSLTCAFDPIQYNTWDVNASNIKSLAPNLNLIIASGNKYKIYSTLNIMEMVYDRVYVMQIQRGFNEMP